MYRKMTYLVSFVLGLGLALTSVADADDPSLVGWWKLDETSGLIAADSSLFGNDGILTSGEWTNGVVGGALEFDGTDGYVSVPSSSSLQLTSALTIAGWIKANNWDSANDVDPIARKGEGNPNNYQLAVVDGRATFYLDGGEADDDGFVGNTPLNTDQWYHIAATWDGVAVRIYVDGVVDNDPSDSRVDAIGTDTRPFYLGGRSGADLFEGTLDDVRLYNRALSEAEIKSLAARPKAWNPSPNDGILYEDTWVSLSWSPGDFALSHDVYFSDNYDNVNDGVESAFQGNQPTVDFVVGFPGFPYPDGLVPGTTYYWRIDEINDTEPNSPWVGYVWSFTVPPKTAYAPDPADGAELVDPGVELSWTAGFGAKLHTVYFGDSFDEVDNAAGALPQGPTTYTPSILKMAKTYYWRIDEFDVVETHKGNVWSFTTEGAVGSPNPANGTVDITQTPILTWTPGFGASHEVYFGTDASSLELKGSGNLGSESYDAGQLEWNTTYYWRIDEANNANADSPWTGPLWSFTTANFLIIDDFEGYNDLEPADPASNRIFNVWLDGLGDQTNGSVVGHENPPFAEQNIIHSGSQSMPLAYDNTVGKSEVTLTLTSNRDWTVKGVNRLTIWFRGDTANAAESMYVALNDSAVVTNDNPNAAQAARWTEWNIDLQAFTDQGVNLANVTSITLGLGNRANPVAGGSGMMYYDDIRLFPPAPPAPPEVIEGLIGLWNFDEDSGATAGDSSGNGHNGTIEGAPTWISPGWDGTGSCMQFGGDSDRITIDPFDLAGSGITLAAWVNVIAFQDDARIISKSEGSGTADHYWAMILSDNDENNLQFRLRTDIGSTSRHNAPDTEDLQLNEWTHIAVTWDAGDPVMRFYKNGQEIFSQDKVGSAVGTNPDVKIAIGNQSASVPGDGKIRPFGGLIDAVRIYDRGLSPEGILELAGQ